ncbi:hypothetical protein K438DRAFT_1995544 [Mycena galopus ATCC 62051]|nr:hypothetical protein K438DRAFT_2001233 [Mycena galopus ATCC 62051]KAF8140957.1 hypothetical protein K438DRAFT_1995544 [Mycena galopus ATCC 62051]
MAGVALIFGPMLIGIMLNLMLYGSIVTQVFRYYRYYSKNFVWIRRFLLYLLTIETANVVIQGGIIYEPLIIEYDAVLTLAPKLLPADPIIIVIVSVPIQHFAAWRINVITHSFILPGVISFLSLVSFGSGINMSVKLFQNTGINQFAIFKTSSIGWLVSSAACDILIAIGMSYALYTRKTGFSHVDGQINRIIRLTLETGAFTAITAIAVIVLSIVFQGTRMNFIADFPLSAVYTCSFLAMLKSRNSADAEHSHRAQTMSSSNGQTTLQGQPSFHRKHKAYKKFIFALERSASRAPISGNTTANVRE